MIKTLLHVPTGEFKNKQGLFEGGPFEPSCPVLSVTNDITTYDPDYAVVVVPSMPNPRTQKWNGSAVVDKTAEELATYDASQPKLVPTRDILRRFTQPERARIRALSRTNDNVADLRDELLAGGETDVNSARFIAGLNFLKAVLIPNPWVDEAAANAAIARIRA